jgi:hypothetical protein
MDAAILLSGFSGLLAAFVASALWATRPTALTGTAARHVPERMRVRRSQRR